MRTLALTIGLFAAAPAALCHDLRRMPDRFATVSGKPLVRHAASKDAPDVDRRSFRATPTFEVR